MSTQDPQHRYDSGTRLSQRILLLDRGWLWILLCGLQLVLPSTALAQTLQGVLQITCQSSHSCNHLQADLYGQVLLDFLQACQLGDLTFCKTFTMMRSAVRIWSRLIAACSDAALGCTA